MHIFNTHSTHSRWPTSIFLLLTLLVLVSGGTGCGRKRQTPLPTVEGTDSPALATATPPISPLTAPVSPVGIPPTSTPSELPAELTGPLTEYTINGGIRADFVHLPFYNFLVWTGITWDGGEYIWVVNNELKAIAGFNVTESISDRLVSFPISLEETPTIMGLAWDGSNFWVSDVKNGMIYEVDSISGEKGEGFAYNGTANGMVWVDGGLWVVSRDRLAIEKFTPSGERQSSYPIGGIWPTGLAWDGKYFWFSDANEGNISILDPQTGKFKQVDEIKFMANRGTFNGLAAMDGYLWIVTEGDERLHRLDVSQLDWDKLRADLQ